MLEVTGALFGDDDVERYIMRFAGDVLGRAAELRAWIDARQGGAGGTLAVGMIDAASLYVLPTTIRAFRETGETRRATGDLPV